MPRNYKSEAEWKKNKYTRILADVDRELGIELKQKLKENNKPITEWITENAKKYLENN